VCATINCCNHRVLCLLLRVLNYEIRILRNNIGDLGEPFLHYCSGTAFYTASLRFNCTGLFQYCSGTFYKVQNHIITQIFHVTSWCSDKMVLVSKFHHPRFWVSFAEGCDHTTFAFYSFTTIESRPEGSETPWRSKSKFCQRRIFVFYVPKKRNCPPDLPRAWKGLQP
jgi:hypothetical protein